MSQIFRPEIMIMREMVDNPDIVRYTDRFLKFVTTITPPVHLVEPLIKILLKTLKESEVSLLVVSTSSLVYPVC
jgi:hypothetical protein